MAFLPSLTLMSLLMSYFVMSAHVMSYCHEFKNVLLWKKVNLFNHGCQLSKMTLMTLENQAMKMNPCLNQNVHTELGDQSHLHVVVTGEPHLRNILLGGLGVEAGHLDAADAVDLTLHAAETRAEEEIALLIEETMVQNTTATMMILRRKRAVNTAKKVEMIATRIYLLTSVFQCFCYSFITYKLFQLQKFNKGILVSCAF